MAELTHFDAAGNAHMVDVGAKAETKLIREGCEQATVTAVFTLPHDNPTFDILEENGIDSFRLETSYFWKAGWIHISIKQKIDSMDLLREIDSMDLTS